MTESMVKQIMGEGLHTSCETVKEFDHLKVRDWLEGRSFEDSMTTSILT